MFIIMIMLQVYFTTIILADDDENTLNKRFYSSWNNGFDPNQLENEGGVIRVESLDDLMKILREGYGDGGSETNNNNFRNQPNNFQHNQINNRIGSSNEGDFHEVALEETNKYRRQHGAPPLVLDNQLNMECQAYAEKLAQTNTMKHSCSMCNEYGENLYMMSGSIDDPTITARQAIQSWYDEVKMYNWNNPTFSSSTGHFTALVWKGTKKMGIGLATNQRTMSTFVVARYVPPGNMMGEFRENVGRGR